MTAVPPSTAFAALAAATPARLGLGRTGPRLRTAVLLRLAADRARARDAVASAVPASWPRRRGLLELATRAADRRAVVAQPRLAATLGPAAAARLRRCRRRPDVQLVVVDATAPPALARSAGPVLAALVRLLRVRRRRLGTTLFVRNARPAVGAAIARVIRPRVLCVIAGELATLDTTESLALHLAARPARGMPIATELHDVHAGGLAPRDAARAVVAWIDAMLGAGPGTPPRTRRAARTSRRKVGGKAPRRRGRNARR